MLFVGTQASRTVEKLLKKYASTRSSSISVTGGKEDRLQAELVYLSLDCISPIVGCVVLLWNPMSLDQKPQCGHCHCSREWFTDTEPLHTHDDRLCFHCRREAPAGSGLRRCTGCYMVAYCVSNPTSVRLLYKALMYRNSLPSAKTKHGRDIGRRAKRGPLFGKEQLRYLGTPKHGLT